MSDYLPCTVVLLGKAVRCGALALAVRARAHTHTHPHTTQHNTTHHVHTHARTHAHALSACTLAAMLHPESAVQWRDACVRCTDSDGLFCVVSQKPSSLSPHTWLPADARVLHALKLHEEFRSVLIGQNGVGVVDDADVSE